ncbi:MAG: hypothetical protein MUF35_01515 [Candidatus Nanopelagicales bacterium]|nr:hypothetical protein [Candidatus Nanopelagicales bacterium]
MGTEGVAGPLAGLVDAAASLLALAGVLLAVAIWVSARDLRAALAVLLDLLLVVGLLRLGLLRTWTDLLVAAALVAVRRVVWFGLAQRSHHPAPAAPDPRR